MAITLDVDDYLPPHELSIPKDLPETDEVPMETPWHLAEIQVLIESVRIHRRGRSNFFTGGNMFIYFTQEQWTTTGKQLYFRGAHFFFVEGVNGRRERRYWFVYDEGGRYPDVIVELTSRSTARIDRTVKKEVYEQIFKTAEYFLYDPETQEFQGWRHDGTKYHAIEVNDRGFLFSEKLGLWLGPWVGTYLDENATWLRLYDESFNLIPLEGELQKQVAEMERQNADLKRLNAELERRKAEDLAISLALEQEKVAAQQEEIARLQALVAGQGLAKNGPGTNP